MSLIPEIPTAPFVPLYPALGSLNFNQEAYAYGTAMPGVTTRLREIAAACRECALAAREDAMSAEASRMLSAQQADQAMSYRNQASASAVAAEASRVATQSFAATVAGNAVLVTDRLLGGRAIAPTTNSQGGPISVGAMYFNTGSNPALKDKWFIWSGSEWKLGPGDYSGAFVPLAGATMAGPLKVRPNATGEEAPQAQEVVQKIGPFNQGGELMGSATFGQWSSYAAVNKASMGADWPFRNNIADIPIHWNALTFGISTRGTQIASQAFAIPGIAGDLAIRTKHDTGWSLWSRIFTDTTVIEREKVATVPAGTTTYSVDPSEGSVHYVVINGSVTFQLPAQGRQLGDQVTLRVYSQGGVRSIGLSLNVQLPVGQPFPTYAANQIVTLVLFYGRQNTWDCFYAGVHAG